MEVAEQKKVKVPKLRFREFEDEWTFYPLESRIDFLAGYAFKSTEMKSQPDKFQLIKMSNVYKSELRLDRNPSYWGKLDEKLKKFLLQKGDVVLTLTGTVNKYDYGYSVSIPEGNLFLLNQRLVRLREKESKSVNGFNQCLVQTTRFFFHFFAGSKGGTGNQSNVSTEDLRQIEVPFPILSEQQKIAEFLSAVDEKLKHLSRKKELLQQYKKGVMQKLFSQELRFKREDGSDYEDWEEKRLGEIGIIQTGKTPSTSDSDLWGGEVQFITPTDIDDDKKYQWETERFVSFNEKLKIIPVGSIVYTCIASIGKISITVKPAITNQQINAVVPNERWNSELVYYQLLWLTPKIKSTQANTTLPIVNKTEFSKIRLKLPSSSEEQQKIASFLSSLDEKIDAVSAHIELTQQFKKGLLQEMFV